MNEVLKDRVTIQATTDLLVYFTKSEYAILLDSMALNHVVEMVVKGRGELAQTCVLNQEG